MGKRCAGENTAWGTDPGQKGKGKIVRGGRTAGMRRGSLGNVGEKLEVRADGTGPSARDSRPCKTPARVWLGPEILFGREIDGVGKECKRRMARAGSVVGIAGQTRGGGDGYGCSMALLWSISGDWAARSVL
jgi:hypothetical protein